MVELTTLKEARANRPVTREEIGALDATVERVQNLNVGIARLLGIPSDITKTLLGAVGVDADVPGTSERLQALGARAGLTPEVGEERQDLLGRTIQNVGSALAPLSGLVAGGRALTQSGGNLAREGVRRLTGRFGATPIEQAAAATVTRPAVALTAEAASAAGAAGGGIVAERLFPDSSAARAIGELAGGVSPGVALAVSPTRVVAGVGERALASLPFTARGGRFRAGRRLRGLAGEPGAAQSAARRLEAAEESPISPARITREPGLVALEKEAAKRDPALAQRLAEGEAAAAATARTEARFGGRPRDAREFIDQLARDAAAEAEIKVARLKPGASAAVASTRVRDTVAKAHSSGRTEETRRWELVDKTVETTLDETNEVWQRMLAEAVPEDAVEDLPSFLRQQLGDFEDSGYVPVDPTRPAGRAQRLRSRLLADIREERPDKQPNRRALANMQELQEALLKDLERSATGDTFTDAVRFSRELNDKFHRGAVGELLNFESTGGRLAVAPEETLQTIIRGEGETPAVRLRQLRAAAPESLADTEQFLQNLFATQAIDEASARVVPRASRTFRAKNAAVLEEFPELKQRILDAEQSQTGVDEMLGAREVSELSAVQRKKSAAALFLQAAPEQEFRGLLRQHDPGRGAKSLLNLTNRDPSGRATAGLKAGWSEFLLRHAEVGSQVDAGGQVLVSGRKLRAFMNDEGVQAISDTLLNSAERQRFNRVVSTFEVLEGPPGVAPRVGDIVEDLPGKLISVVARVGGAQVGRQVAQGTGGGTVQTPGIIAGAASDALRGLTTDKARGLLLQAIEDPKLMEVLLTESRLPLPPAKLGILRAALAGPVSTAVGEKEPLREQDTSSHAARIKRFRQLRSRGQPSSALPASR